MSYSSLKLINSKSGVVLAEIINDRIVFFNSELENELRINGISIPNNIKNDFGGKRLIEFSDELFVKAFIDVYCPLYMKESGYELVPAVLKNL